MRARSIDRVHVHVRFLHIYALCKYNYNYTRRGAAGRLRSALSMCIILIMDSGVQLFLSIISITPNIYLPSVYNQHHPCTIII